jgi:polyisoprenyl-phosphate glycosyltransferase
VKLISIVIACYNEEENVLLLYEQIREILKNFPCYQYEYIFIDNDSTDNTQNILRQIAQKDSNLKIIANSRNFGHIRSPYYGLLQAKGDAVISMAADLQDPPQMLYEYIKAWEEGYKVVIGIKAKSEESKIMFMIRKLYYKFVARISEVDLVKDFTGFGLYDKQVLKILKEMQDPYPYFRGLIADIGFTRKEIPYVQPRRKHGVTKNNFYTLYDMAMLGITTHSKLPLRIATFAGFLLSLFSFLIALIFFILKILFWNSFNNGIAPILCGLFFYSSIQLFFIGLLGEYIGSIHTRLLKRPLVIEKERINFDVDAQQDF